MATFVMVVIIMISQYIDSEVPRVCDVLQLMNVLPCYKIKAFKLVNWCIISIVVLKLTKLKTVFFR
jgi:hypothetical protein